MFIVAACLGAGCDSLKGSRSKESVARHPGVADLAPTEPTVEPLRAPKRYQFRLSDFPQPNPTRIISVDLNLKGPRSRRRREDSKQAMMEILRRRVSAPYELRHRKDLERGERAWGRLYVTHRWRLDRYKKRGKKTPRRGKLRFGVELATRFPDDLLSNWESYRYNVVFEREYDQLLGLDADLWRAFERQLPTLAAAKLENILDVARQLQIRDELVQGKLHEALRYPLVKVHPGGCAVARTESGPRLFRLDEPQLVGPEIPDPDRTAIQCDSRVATIAHATTDRSVDLTTMDWNGETKWEARASFARAIDVEHLRFIVNAETLCLVGERRLKGQRYAKLQCFDAESGRFLWERVEPGTDIEAVVAERGAVLLAAGRHLRILELRSGREVWSREVEGASGLAEASGACVLKSEFVFPTGLGRYLAFDVAERRAHWELATFGGDFFYCDGAGGLYFDEAGGELLAVDLETMDPRWRFRVAEHVQDALFHGGYLFVLMPGAIFVLDANTGEIAWEIGLPVPGIKLHRFDRRLYLEGETVLFELTRPDRL